MTQIQFHRVINWLRLALRRHAILLIIIVVTAVLQSLGESGAIIFRFDREAISQGEWWRLMTGNWVHLNWSHWLLNNAGWVLVWLFYYRLFSARVWFLLILGTSLAVGVGLLSWTWQINYYVGLSGALHGLFCAGALAEIRRGWRVGGIILMCAVVGKLTWEQLYGALPTTAELSGGPVVVDAHFYGAVGGLILGVVIETGRKVVTRRPV